MNTQWYITRVDRFDYPKGTLVQLFKGHDYGCARDDTLVTGERHVSVTTTKDGGYPFFTIPEEYLTSMWSDFDNGCV